MRAITVVAGFLSLASCSSDTKSIPSASGMPGDLYVVMDSLQWKGPLGKMVDSVFSAEMPGLPRKEAIFKLRWVDPRKFNYILKEMRNLIFVMTLDQHSAGGYTVQKLFTPESLDKIKNNPMDYSRTTYDLYARGQVVLFLYGKDEQALLQNFHANSAQLVSFFNQKEKERMTKSLFKAGQLKGVTEILNKEFNCDLKIPFGYKLAHKTKDFLWVRQINPRDDKTVFIARKPYASQKDFTKESLIRFRDDITRKYLFEDPEVPDSYIVTETAVPYIPVTADTVNFNGHFAMQLRGIWRTNTMGMGGPFQGYALVDEGTQQFYYVEGFTFSPRKDQREIMRELETILYTFKTSGEIQPK